MTLPNGRDSLGSDASSGSHKKHPSCINSLRGCEHLSALQSQNRQKFDTLMKRYGEMQFEFDLSPSIRRVSYRCLECSQVSDSTGRDDHARESGHKLSAESSCQGVFCHQCGDFVYDSDFENIRNYGPDGLKVGRKRKIDDDEESEDPLLRAHTLKRACGPTGIRGLYNLGQTCYQNVILQSLLHNPLLTAFFLRDGHQTKTCEKQPCLGCATAEAFGEFYNPEKNEGYGATGLLLSTWQANPGLGGYRQQDAHEFFQFLVDKLHESAVGDNNNLDCKCFFHKAFHGQLQSTVTCSKCKNITVQNDPIMDLSLDMQVQAKKRAIETSKSPRSTLDLDNCLKSYTAPEKLVTDAYTCQICEGPQPVSKELRIRKLPAILCFQLKRFDHSTAAEKLEGKLDFPLELNMLPYTTRPRTSGKKRSKYMYDLQSAIIHKGKIDSGHYVAYCRQGDEWFLFDDDKIYNVPEAEVLGIDAYLLFYSLRSMQMPKKRKEKPKPKPKQREKQAPTPAPAPSQSQSQSQDNNNNNDKEEAAAATVAENGAASHP